MLRPLQPRRSSAGRVVTGPISGKRWLRGSAFTSLMTAKRISRRRKVTTETMLLAVPLHFVVCALASSCFYPWQDAERVARSEQCLPVLRAPWLLRFAMLTEVEVTANTVYNDWSC